MHQAILSALALATLGTAGGPAPAAPDSVPLYDNLGTHHYQITTADPMAQRYFDQGLRLYYAFNHFEAVRAFREGARRDPDCAMCWWGVAMAYGPNINLPMDEASGLEAFAAVREAQARAHRVTEREKAFIEAAALRYGADPLADRTTRDSAYARAMGEVSARLPGDVEAAVLHAEALMNLRPWNYWTKEGEPQPGTRELLSTLERVLDANPRHPGACHFFIHAVEEVHPERAVPCAERLADLMPGAGHLVHMPGHIYIRVGRYMDAIRANEHAVHADESYIRDQRPGPGMYTVGYYPHNYDFMAFAAAMAGLPDLAIEAADKVAALIPAEMLRAPGMTLLQNFVTRNLQMRVRFARWDEILATPAPDEDLPYARAVWHYARGRALLGSGEAPAARTELAHLRAIGASEAMEGITLEFNDARTLLGIATRVLEGRILSGEGRHRDAARVLREAASLEDAMVYGEPPEWSVPVRHDLGQALLAAGDAAAAEAVFQEDLRRFPENGWALDGLVQALRAQGKSDEAAQAEARLLEAWEAAFVAAERARHSH